MSSKHRSQRSFLLVCFKFSHQTNFDVMQIFDLLLEVVPGRFLCLMLSLERDRERERERERERSFVHFFLRSRDTHIDRERGREGGREREAEGESILL